MKAETQSFYAVAVRRAVEHVITHLDVALDLERLARGAAMSVFHFHRVFRGMVGETPLELHRRLRLERAAWQTLNSDAPIVQLAFDAGYETHESFTRAFRAHYNHAPTELRQSRALGGADCARPFQIELAARSGIHFQPQQADTSRFDFIQGGHAMHVEILNMPDKRVACVRHIGPYNQISEAFSRLGAIVDGSGLIGAGCEMLAIYHDDFETTPPAELRSDAGVTVPKDARLPAGLTEQQLPGGTYARFTHIGPYEQLGDAWSRLMGQWLPNSGRRLGNGVSYEIYRNTPGNTPDEKLHTDLYIPLSEATAQRE